MSKVQAEILLESGTNEVEIFEFLVDGNSYGVNALKVRQVNVFQKEKVQEYPKMPEGMLGNVLIRNEIIRVIDTRMILGMERTPRPKRPIMLFCEFNRQVLAFVVDEIIGIARVNWNQFQSPSHILKTTSITGVAVIGDKKISMLDFESMVVSLFGIVETQDEKGTIVDPVNFPAGFKILVADDSPVVRKKLNWILQNIGAQDVEVFENGALLMIRYMELHNAQEKVGLVISDIEMPQLDGLACCKKIKTINPGQPFLIVSSLINDQIYRKCKEVGADVALNKEELPKLRDIIAQFTEMQKAA
jgi:two-component system, chemotaxis family, chemotaxis protein CheV